MNLEKTKLIPPTFLIGILGILLVSIYNSAFKNNKFTCNRYILNSYLYILLTIVIVILEILIFEYKNIKIEDIYGNINNALSLFLCFILIIILLVFTMSINPQNVLLKHFTWLLLSLSFGLLVFPSYIRAKKNNILLEVLFSLISILVIFSVVAFIKPDIISLSIGPILLFSLIGIIIFQIVNYLFHNNKKKYRTPKWLSYIIIVLFIFFILYDTRLIQIHAKTCQTKRADYINESLEIFLDLLNLFQQLVNVKS